MQSRTLMHCCVLLMRAWGTKVFACKALKMLPKASDASMLGD
jgi:hypothetical protein